MQLIEVDKEFITASASIILTGISSNDDYLITYCGVQPNDDNKDLYMRFGNSGTAYTSSNYYNSSIGLLADASFQSNAVSGNGCFIIEYARGNASEETNNGVIDLYNVFPSGKSPTAVWTQSGANYGNTNASEQGGGALSDTSSYSEVHFAWESGGNFKANANGYFALYKVVRG